MTATFELYGQVAETHRRPFVAVTDRLECRDSDGGGEELTAS